MFMITKRSGLLKHLVQFYSCHFFLNVSYMDFACLVSLGSMITNNLVLIAVVLPKARKQVVLSMQFLQKW
jgi:hypothetical protein